MIIISAKGNQTSLKTGKSLGGGKGVFQFSSPNMKKILMILACLLFPVQAWAVYDLPNNDADCPANCRQVLWKAGSDLWNNGSLPNYTPVTCTGLHGDGTTDDSGGIEACINNASASTAVYLPAATYYLNAPIRLKSNVVLRGAGPTSTVINLGSNAVLTSQRWSNTDSSCLNPPTTYGVASSGFLLSGTPHKGDTQLTLQNPGNVNVGSWISVFSDDDPSLVTGTGEDGFCAWCADNAGSHFLQQIVQVTAKNGTSITISRPLYYTLHGPPVSGVYLQYAKSRN